jgi:hypothetical protein
MSARYPRRSRVILRFAGLKPHDTHARAFLGRSKNSEDKHSYKGALLELFLS